MAYEIQLNDDEKFLLTNGSGDGIDDITLDGTVTVTGDLFVLGNRTQLDTSTLTVEDRIITVGRGMQATSGVTSQVDTGVVFERGDSANHNALIWKDGLKSFEFIEVATDADTALDTIDIEAYSDIGTGNIFLHNVGTDSEVAIIHSSEIYRTTNEGSIDFGSVLNVRSTNNATLDKNTVEDYYRVTAGAIREEKYAHDGESYWRLRAAPSGPSGTQITYTQDLLFGSEGLFYNGSQILTQNGGGFVTEVNGLQGAVALHLYDLLDVEGDHATLADPYNRLEGKYLQYHVSDGLWKPSFIETISEILDVDDTGKLDRKVLQWNDTNQLWQPSNSIMVEELWELNDVDIAARNAPSPNSILKYNDTSESWEATFIQTLNEITAVDADPTAADDRKALVWSDADSAWVLSENISVRFLDDLEDVDAITDLAEGSLIKYNMTDAEWQVGIIDFLDEIGNVTALRADPNNLSADDSQNEQFLKYNANTGMWEANIMQRIDEIGNVNIPDYNLLNEGDVLKWNDTGGQFEFGTALDKLFFIGDVYEDELTIEDGRYLVWDSAGPSGPGWYKSANGQVQVLNDLLDCTVLQQDLGAGKILRYNDGLEQWEPGIVEQLSEVGDVSIQYPDLGNPTPFDIQSGQWLYWTGSVWTHRFIERAQEILDITVLSPEAGQFLKWNPTLVGDLDRGIIGGWENAFMESIDEIGNVSLSGISHGKVLEWDQTVNGGAGGFIPSESVRVEYLNDLLDVTVPTDPATITFGSILRFNGSQWTTFEPLFVSDLDSVTDVTITLPQNGHVLTYQAGEWVNASVPHPTRLTQLFDDVSISGPQANEVLTYDGSNWVNSTTIIVDVLDDLDDVAITAPADNDILRYNNATGQWANTSLFIPSIINDLADVRLDDNGGLGFGENAVLSYNATDNVWENRIQPVFDQLGDLTDVTISVGVGANQVLAHDGVGWVNRPFSFADTLGELLDVDLSGLSTNDVITWDGSTWVASSPGELTLPIEDLSNVNTGPLQNGQVLTYNGPSGEWTNTTPVTQLGQLSDVDTTGQALGEYLRYDGLRWVSVPLDAGDVADAILEGLALTELSDVASATAIDNDILIYDTGIWRNATPSEMAGLGIPLQSLQNVSIATPQDNWVLSYDQAAGDYRLMDVAAFVAGALGIPNTPGTNDGDILQWNTTSGTFEVGTLGAAAQGSNQNALLTWDGTAWIANDVGNIQGTGNGNVLTWDGTQWQSLPLPEDKFIRLLSELDDVETDDLASIQNNQILRWNATNQYWENVDWPSIGLHMLEDVQFTGLTDRQIAFYNAISSQWENADIGTIASEQLRLDHLNDVSATMPADGSLLTYQSGTGRWVAENGPDAIASSGAGLTSLVDVASFTPTATNKYLVWNQSTALWEAADIDFASASIDQLGDITVAGLNPGDILVWDGANWVNQVISIPNNLDDLLDVSTTNPANGAFLEYDQGVNEWVARTYNVVNNIADMDDVNVTGVGQGDTLIYQGGTWVPIQVPPVTIEIRDLTDVDTAIAPINGDQLQWDAGATQWVAFTPVQPFIPTITSELSDVTLTNPQDGQVLIYTVANGWENQNLLDANPVSMSDLSDTGFTNLADNEILTFNDTTSRWENRTIQSLVAGNLVLNDLTNVNATGSATNNLLRWSGSQWTAGQIQDLDEINGVNTIGRSNGDALVWTGASWEAGTPSNVDATTLDGLDSTSYARADTADNVTQYTFSNSLAIRFDTVSVSQMNRVNAGDTSIGADNTYFRRTGTLLTEEADATVLAGQFALTPAATATAVREGALWANSTDNTLNYYDGSNWIDIVGFARDVNSFVVQGGTASVSDLTITGPAIVSVDGASDALLQVDFKDLNSDTKAWIRNGGLAIADVDNATFGNSYLETAVVSNHISVYAKGDDLFQRTAGQGSEQIATITDVRNEIAVATASFAEISGGALSLGIGNTFIRLNIQDNITSTLTLDDINNLDNGNMVTIMPTANSVITQWGASTRLQITLTGVAGIYVNGVFTNGSTVTIDLSQFPGLNLYYYEDAGSDFVVIHAA